MADAQVPLLLDPDEYLADCFRLANKIWADGYRPDFLVVPWRGGALPGIVIDELFRYNGHEFSRTAIRMESLGRVVQGVRCNIRGLGHMTNEVESGHKMLIVDDLFNTGQTMYEVIEYLRRRARCNTPEIRVATVYSRLGSCAFLVSPHYYLHSVLESPVFPHELTAFVSERLAETDPELFEAISGSRQPDPAAGTGE